MCWGAVVMITILNYKILHTTIKRSDYVLRFDNINIIFPSIIIAFIAINLVTATFVDDHLGIVKYVCNLLRCNKLDITTILIVVGMIYYILGIIIYVGIVVIFSTTKRRRVKHNLVQSIKNYPILFKTVGLCIPQTKFLHTIILSVMAFGLALIFIIIYKLIIREIGFNATDPRNFVRDNIIGIITTGLYLVVFAPIFEEIIYRGLLIKYSLNSVKVIELCSVYVYSKQFINIGTGGFNWSIYAQLFTIIATGLIFGISHPSETIISSAIIGIVLGWLRFATGSIWPCIVVHSAWNSMVYTLILITSTIDYHG